MLVKADRGNKACVAMAYRHSRMRMILNLSCKSMHRTELIDCESNKIPAVSGMTGSHMLRGLLSMAGFNDYLISLCSLWL